MEVVEKIELAKILPQIPDCKALVTTGQKATEILLSLIDAPEPRVGEHSTFTWNSQTFGLYRMPSSSRAYPRPVEEKAKVYEKMFRETGIL